MKKLSCLFGNHHYADKNLKVRIVPNCRGAAKRSFEYTNSCVDCGKELVFRIPVWYLLRMSNDDFCDDAKEADE